MNIDRRAIQKRREAGSSQPQAPTSILMLGVYFFAGWLLVLGQLVPGGTQQVASGESLPQGLLWLLVGALLATDGVLARYGALRNRFILSRQETSRLPMQSWLIMLGAGMLVWMLMATWNVYGQGNLRFAVNGCWQWFAWAVTIIILSRMMMQPRLHRSLQWLMIALAWSVSVHGFYQVFISLPADRERFREDPQAVLREAGIDAPPGSSTYLLFEQRLQDDSPTGPFALTNSLAGFLVPWILILLAQSLRREVWTGEQRWWRWVGLSVTGCLCLCLLWTKSRTGWIALGVGAIAIVLSGPWVFRVVYRGWQGLWLGDVDGLPASARSPNGFSRRSVARRNPIGLGLTLAAVLIISFTVLGLGLLWWDPKLFSEAGRSLAFRSEYWRTTLRIVADHPWLGIGPGNFQSYYAMYKPVLESETIADPHNFLLETLVTAGFPSLLMLLALLLGLTLPFLRWRARASADAPASIDHTLDDESLVGSRSVSRMVYACLVGAVVGAAAIWLSKGALGPMPDVVPYLFAIPIALAVVTFRLTISASSRRTADQASMSACGFGPALLGMSVHLMASGGWMTPGISNTIAVLVAGLWVSAKRDSMAASLASNQPPLASMESAFRRMPSVSSFAMLLMAWLLVAAFYLTAWLPKQRTQQVEAEVDKRGGIDESLAIAMCEADPWSPVGFRWLADVRLTQAKRESMNSQSANAPSFQRFQESAQAYLALDRVNWETWAQLGHWELAISPAKKESLNRALQFYREASQRAPGDVGLLTQAALAAWLAEDISALQAFLSRAEAIDSKITHADRKLEKAILFWPANVGPPSTKVAPAVWQAARESANLPLDWVRAEPVYRFLRSQAASLQAPNLR